MLEVARQTVGELAGRSGAIAEKLAGSQPEAAMKERTERYPSTGYIDNFSQTLDQLMEGLAEVQRNLSRIENEL